MVRARRHQGDINHVTGDVHYITCFLNRRRTILAIHDCEILERTSGVKGWILWALWFWLPEKRCRAIVAVSEETKSAILSYLGCDPDKIVVIHDPVTDLFQPSPKPFSKKRPRLLQIGTKNNKNLDRVAEALRGLACDLVIVGPLSDSQRKTLNVNGIAYVNRRGLSDLELLDEYVTSDVLVFASTYEGFGLPIVEANAVGRPVVTSKISSMPEVAGDSACFVDPFDVSSIRNGIRRVIEDSEYREQLILKGFSNWKRFHPERISAQYAELYRKIYRQAQKSARNYNTRA